MAELHHLRHAGPPPSTPPALPLALVLKAASFAAHAHRAQRRKDADGDPYINHPLEVARILAEEGGVEDPVTLAAALLHDTVEDTDTTLEDVERAFGPAVRAVVAEVTDDKSLPGPRRKELQVECAPHKSARAKLVKLGDKLHNLRCLERSPPVDWTPERILAYFHWAQRVVAGLRGSNAALEAALDGVFQRGIAAAEARVAAAAAAAGGAPS